MHAVTFQLKRSHLCSVRLGLRLFQGTPGKEDAPDFDGVRDMTPARFDILFVILQAGGRIAHNALRAQLGLSGATISKGIKRLVELGLVHSFRDSRDARRKAVTLSREGRSRIGQALDLLSRERFFARRFRKFAARYADPCASTGIVQRTYLALDSLWSRAAALSRHLGDTAFPHYRC